MDRRGLTDRTLERDKEDIWDRTYILWEGTTRRNRTGGRDGGDERTEEY